MPEKLKAAALVRDTREKNLATWRPYWDAMDLEEAFVDGDRYKDDNHAYNKDRRRTQIRGQEIFDTIRHVSAKATDRPRSVEARPVDDEQDAEMSQIAVSLVDHELSNDWKEFDDVYYEAIVSAREKRLGIVWMDWDPKLGPFGEMIYRYEDPRNVMWDSKYKPHHPKCNWLLVRTRVDISWVQENYPKAKWVKPDREVSSNTSDVDRAILSGMSDSPLNAPLPEDDRVTLDFMWIKNDKTKGKKKVEGDFDELKTNDRFMQCQECGFQSESQEKLRTDGDFKNDFPEELEGGCPHCLEKGESGNLQRIDAKAIDKVQRAFKNGKRLIIIAPFSPGPEDEPVTDGSWPIPSARSFPALFITAYIKPGKPMGPSDTYLMWDQQKASDELRTLALQRVFEHRNYWELPEAGLKDRHGKRFMFREDQFNVMFRDATQAFPSEVKVHGGTGLDPAWNVAFGATQEALTALRPKLDLGLNRESSRNIPVGTVETLEREASIPIEEFNRRKNRELGKFYGVVWDYVRSTYTPERLTRLRMEGIDLVQGIQGDDLPNFDFVLKDTPPFGGAEKQKAETAQLMMQTLVNPETAPYAEELADTLELPTSVVKKFMAKFEILQQQAAEAQAKAEEEEDMILNDAAERAGGDPDGDLPPEFTDPNFTAGPEGASTTQGAPA